MSTATRKNAQGYINEALETLTGWNGTTTEAEIQQAVQTRYGYRTTLPTIRRHLADRAARIEKVGHPTKLVDRGHGVWVFATDALPADWEEDEQGYPRPIDPELLAQRGACGNCGDHHEGDCFA